MIVITGAAGFIGSCLVAKLNEERFYDLVLVDDFRNELKKKNLADKKFTHKIDRKDFPKWLENNHRFVQFVFHIGARTDTTEFDKTIFDKLNLNYSKTVWNICTEYGLPLVYASSAATYGGGEHGYSDDHDQVHLLRPLNPYGESKQQFDEWVLSQKHKPFFWCGLKFFNVYGPNEYHKGRMASVIFHAYHQAVSTGKIKLFRSHRKNYKDGEQLRDFVYVKDVTEVCYWLMHHRKNSGLYNLGTGQARTFISLAENVFRAINCNPKVEFVDTPEDIRNKYQYFTEANMEKLKNIGYAKSFFSLEEGIGEYIKQYLLQGKYW